MNTELIARLEAAEVGSRELDAEVWAASVGYELVSFDGAGWLYKMHPNDIQRHERTGYINPYTTSLDSALALAERVLPGWRMHCLQDQLGIYQYDNTSTRWSVGMSEKRGPGMSLSYAHTPAIALCIAILCALDAQEQK